MARGPSFTHPVLLPWQLLSYPKGQRVAWLEDRGRGYSHCWAAVRFPGTDVASESPEVPREESQCEVAPAGWEDRGIL